MAIDRAIDLLSPQKGKKVLDYGCGSGSWSVYLSLHNFEAVGIDIDREAIRIYKDRVPNSSVILTSLESNWLPVGDGAIDLIIVISLSQMFVYDWFFTEAARVLKPGGFVVGTLQNRLSWRGLIQKLKSAVVKTENPFKITFSDLREKSKRERFDLIFSRGFGWIPVSSRQMDSSLIPIFSFFEKLFLLGYVKSISPNVVFILMKCE